MLNQESIVRDLAELAYQGELQPIFERDRELYAIMEVLARHGRKSVLLVGPKGVGKTRLVEGLAVASYNGDTQGLIDQLHLVDLDLSVFATSNEDQEQKLRRLLKHIRQSRDMVLCIDGIHESLSGADGDRVDIEKLLRPVLSRGEISCIGTTDPEHFEAELAHDPLIKNHFEVIPVEPLSEKSTGKVLRKLKEKFERHHNVRISNKSLHAAVVFAQQFLPHQPLPGAAIELLDQACTRYRLKTVVKVKDTKLFSDDSLHMIREEVSPHDVKKIAEKLAGSSTRHLLPRDDLAELGRAIRKNVLGQEMAVSETVDALRVAAQRSPGGEKGPRCILLFAGPNGVGKRFFGRELADAYAGSSSRFVDINVLEFDFTSLAEGIDKKLGASGITKQEGRFVLYFDGIQDAKPEAYGALMAFLAAPSVKVTTPLEDGIVIFGAVVPPELFRDTGEDPEDTDWVTELRDEFSADFLGHVDALVPFLPFSDEDLDTILHIPINQFRDELQADRIALGMQKKVYGYLSRKCYNDEEGLARLNRAVEKYVRAPVRALIKEEGVRGPANIIAYMNDNRIGFRVEPLGQKEAHTS